MISLKIINFPIPDSKIIFYDLKLENIIQYPKQTDPYLWTLERNIGTLSSNKVLQKEMSGSTWLSNTFHLIISRASCRCTIYMFLVHATGYKPLTWGRKYRSQK